MAGVPTAKADATGPLAAAVETGTLEAHAYRRWLAAAQDAERGGYHSDTFVGMVVSARKPEPGRAAIARYHGTRTPR